MIDRRPLRERLIEKFTTDCRHFNGVMNNRCDAGIEYNSITESNAKRLPCLRRTQFGDDKREVADCQKFETMTLEEATATAEADEKRSKETLNAVASAHKDAAAKGFKKGNGGRGEMPCPVPNCSGTLHYSVAGYNGHMHARCSTPSCVSWME